MGKTDFISRSPKHCLRLNNSFSLCSVSKSLSSDSGSTGVNSSSGVGSSKPPGKGGGPSVRYHKRKRAFTAVYFCPQKGGRHAACDRPQFYQSVCREFSLPNGKPFSYKDSFKTRSLHGKTRLKRCLFFSSSTPRLPKVSPLCLEKQSVPVSGPPFRVEHSPSSVHPVTKTRIQKK